MDSKTENTLAIIAEKDLDDNKATRAMKILRERYDKKYRWCPELDYAVVKEPCDFPHDCDCKKWIK